MKQKEIIEKIEAIPNNYRDISKECVKSYANINDFQKTILAEVICKIITEQCSIEDCFSQISKEYKINCKRIVFWAIISAMKIPGIKAKILFLLNMDQVIYICININPL